MVLAGLRRSTATKLSGHRTESVFVRYVIRDKGMLDDGVSKLGRFHEATSAATRTKAEEPAVPPPRRISNEGISDVEPNVYSVHRKAP